MPDSIILVVLSTSLMLENDTSYIFFFFVLLRGVTENQIGDVLGTSFQTLIYGINTAMFFVLCL